MVTARKEDYNSDGIKSLLEKINSINADNCTEHIFKCNADQYMNGKI
jgi:hypothetical protein